MRRVEIRRPGVRRINLKYLNEGEEKELIMLIRGEEQGEYQLDVVSDHKVGRTFGRVIVRGIAKNGARVKVSGLIKIAKQAQGVEDFLEMKLLVLDGKSSAVAEPKLEIMANEVKASHAATVGRVDEEEMFYLTARGICRKNAEKMIVEGFLEKSVG